jgi:uncharacterized protein
VSSSPPSSFSHPGPPPLHPELPDGVERSPAPAVARGSGPLALVPAWAPFAAMLVTFVVASIASVALVAAAELGGSDIVADSLPPGVLISGSVVQDVALVVFAYVFARMWVSPVRPSTFGLRRTPVLPALGWAALVYLGFWICAAIYAAVLGPGDEQELVTDLKDEDSLVVLVGFGFLVSLIAPLVEELFFRGFMFGVLREKMNVYAAMVVAGGVFGLIHIAGTPVRTLGILVILGVALCFLYYKTNSILPAMGLHALHNSISFGATKELTWWLFILLMIGSVGLVLAVAGALVARERAPV